MNHQGADSSPDANLGRCESAATVDDVRRFCLDRQASAFGIVELASVRTDDFLLPDSILKGLPLAISIAMRLSPSILATLEDRPNQLYEHHYRQANFALDRLALAATNYIQSLGHKALPIPASQIVDWQNQRAHLSHKRIAVAAGLGWLGRNNLLVTPRFGAQVRLVTILTDLNEEHNPIASTQLGLCPKPLTTDRQPSAVSCQPFSCGSCRACIAVCPAKAISDRPEDFHHEACYEKLKEFQRRHYVSQYICGLCVRACAGTRSQQPTANS